MARAKTGIELYRAASKTEKAAEAAHKSAAPKQPESSQPQRPRRNKPQILLKTTQETPEKPRTPAAAGGASASGAADVSGVPAGSGSKAARFLLLLGLEDAAAVVSRLNADEAEELARHIAQVSRVDAVEAQQLLDEFGQHFSGVQAKRARGGKDAARNILEAAFGEDKAKAILASALPEEQPLPFSFLNDCSFEQLVTLLSKEPSSSLALVMAYLEPSLSSALLESLPDEQRAAVVIRMARTEKVSRDVLETVEDSLREKLRLIGRDESEELDGRAALADILRHMDLEDEKRLLGGLEDADPLLAHQVKEKLYTMDSVLHLRRKDLQQLLLDMDEKEIAMILKGQTPEIRQCIEEALSSRRKLLVEDERVILGPQPRSEVDKSVRSFLDRIQKAEEEGRFIILREESDLIE